MLYQLHHQNKIDTSKTIFCSQRKLETGTAGEEYHEWQVETQKKFPLPKGFQWLLCNEDSEYFIKTTKP